MMHAKALLVLFLMSPATALCADGPLISFKGRWHVDLEKSVVPFSPNTKDVQLEITTDDGKMFEASETVTRTDGQTTTESYRIPVDGDFHPVRGSPVGASIAITRRALGSIATEMRAPDGLQVREACTLSADQNTLVCEFIGTDSHGKTTPAKSVYVRD